MAGVSLLEVRKFCEWLSPKKKKPYRLPTAVEWRDEVDLRGLESQNSIHSWLNGKVKDHYPWAGRSRRPVNWQGTTRISSGTSSFPGSAKPGRTAMAMQPLRR